MAVEQVQPERRESERRKMTTETDGWRRSAHNNTWFHVISVTRLN